MIRKYLIPLLAVAGVLFAAWKVSQGSKPRPAAVPVAPPAEAPYPSFVAGAGLVEANTENIAIGTHIAGIVTKVDVAVGSDVKAGDPLFTIDDREARAAEEVRQAAVRVAEAQLADAKTQLALAESVADKRAMSQQDLDKRRATVLIAEAQLAEARAQLNAIETEIQRLTVRAPVAGQVLQVKVRAGEFAPTGPMSQPLVLLGGVTPLHVRVDVDENDAWRVKPGAVATGYLRGNKDIASTLEFVRFEPYVVPKKSLTGESTERVDTRVLQVIYRFDRGGLPVYVGQQMDVFIEAGKP